VTGATVPAVPLREDVPIPSLLVLVTWLVIAGVVLFALPALVLGARGLFRRRGYSPVEPGDRSTIVLLITGRAIVLLLVLVLTALVLVSSVGALLKDVELHGAVYVFCVLDLLLAALILLTFGRPEPRPARRRASPAGR
jgi:heme/copper-type cytochrome/quinol oxidase subunit 1